MTFLIQQELVGLTGKVRPTAQARALDYMGVYYRKRPDGSLVVLREHMAPNPIQVREPALRFAK